MTAIVLPMLVAVPLLVAGALIIAPDRAATHRTALLATLAGSTTLGVVLVIDQATGPALGHQVGAWPAGVAIPFVADMLTALMLTVTGLLALVCSAFAIASGESARRFFAPLVLVLTAGVNGALLTADLFNLFVFIEVMLLPSYALLILSARGRGTGRRVAGVRLYVLVNLLTSTIFLAGVGFVYGVTGTVNIAELAGAARESGTVALAVAICLFALSIKAAVVPVHGWLARTYTAPSPGITALFSGLHTKVAIYAIYRIYAVIFDGDPRYLWVGVLMFSITMVVGVYGAVGENSTRSILAFHMISQIGYILLGVALFGPLGLTAGIFYLLHHMIVKASLFLSTGAVEIRYGSLPLGAVRGMARREPLIAVAFFAAALSLAGLPPFSGFLAKLTLVRAAIDVGQIAVAVIAVAVSLLTLLSMLKIWGEMFLRQPDPSHEPEPESPAVGPDGDLATRTRPRIGFALAAPALVLAVVTLGLGLGGELLLSLSAIAAEGLLDTSGYVQAVLGS